MSEHDPAAPGMDTRAPSGWERQALENLLSATLVERRRARRWNIFFRILFWLFAFSVLFLVWPRGDGGIPVGRHTALIDLNGVIADNQQASADNLIPALREAFDDKHTVGIILRANSPGGSPVQAAYLYDEIRRLRKLHPKVPVYAVVTDMCASACYYIISAADRIYANRGSLVGSIGVLYDGFGFTGLMDKLGIQRRLLTAGEHKGMMDPFSPQNPEDVKYFKGILEQVHQQFIAAVKQGRGDRLKTDTPGLFSGLVWTGATGVKLGLVDGLASPGQVARDVIGADNVVDYTPREDLLDRLSNTVGAAVGRNLLPARSGLAPLR